jgi:hypothetical protein
VKSCGHRDGRALLACDDSPRGWIVEARLPDDTDARGTYLRNASELPVYEVTIDFYNESADSFLEDVGTVRGRIVPPGLTFVDGPERLRTDFWETKDFVVEISFRDTAGRQWIRFADGMLSEDRNSSLPRPAKPHNVQFPRIRQTRRNGWQAAALVVIGVAVLLIVT